MYRDKINVFFIIAVILSVFISVPAFAEEEMLPPDIEPGIAISVASSLLLA